MTTIATTLPTPTAPARAESAGLRALAARWLFATSDDGGALLARLALALVFFPHGAQKVLGWFGGYGFSGTLAFMTGTLGIPTPLAVVAILTELLAPLALLVGAGSRLAAAGIAAIMVVATLTVHLPHGFFMNWSGAQQGEGFEYHLLALALALVVVVRGGGRWAVDQAAARRLGA